MKIKGKVWKQGNSLLVTLPAKQSGIKSPFKEGDTIEFEPKIIGRMIVCDCGKLYYKSQQADHICNYHELDTEKDAFIMADHIKRNLVRNRE